MRSLCARDRERSLMEAVEILAREKAGMPMPKQDPRAQEKADKRTSWPR